MTRKFNVQVDSDMTREEKELKAEVKVAVLCWLPNKCSWDCVSRSHVSLFQLGQNYEVSFLCLYEWDSETRVAVGRQLPAWVFPGWRLLQGLVVLQGCRRLFNLVWFQSLVKPSLSTTVAFVCVSV